MIPVNEDEIDGEWCSIRWTSVVKLSIHHRATAKDRWNLLCVLDKSRKKKTRIGKGELYKNHDIKERGREKRGRSIMAFVSFSILFSYFFFTF